MARQPHEGVAQRGDRGGVTGSEARARTAAVVAAVIGLAVATAVIGYFKVGSVLAAIRPIGVEGFLVAIVAQVSLFVTLGLSWWLVAPGEPGRRAPLFMAGRLSREAASDVLPFSQFGGIVIAARVAILGGVATGTAFGSIVVDLSFEMIAQLIYTLVGVALLVHHLGLGGGNNKLLFSLIGGMAFAVVMVTSFIATQTRGLKVMEGFAVRLVPAAAEHASAVAKVVEAAYSKPLRLWITLALHVFSWFAAAVGTWLILWFMDRPLPYLSVVAIESLLFAIRNAAFIAPSGLGVQEGAYALLGPLFGLPAEAALALSLVKRARDIAIGVPVLLIWQVFEGRRPLRDAN
jgi:putative membrane protein